ncbi:hypothetical protein B7494_g6703 [Chlorociboria aeruginascens]|nr:hypothetical protein B7494_g6703 [Chlorociboria aeruginascens]
MNRHNPHNMSLALPRLPTRREAYSFVDRTFNTIRPVAKGAVAWLEKRVDLLNGANEKINDSSVQETDIVSDLDNFDSGSPSPTSSSSDLCGSEYTDSTNVFIAAHEKDRVTKEIAEAMAAVNLKPWRTIEEDATRKDYMKESVLFQISQDEEQKRQRARIAKEWAKKAERPIEGRRRYHGEGATEDELENWVIDESDKMWVPSLQQMGLTRKPSNASQDIDLKSEKSFNLDKTEGLPKEKRRTSSATEDQIGSRKLDKVDRIEELTLQSSSSFEDQYSALHTVVDDAQRAQEIVKRWDRLLRVRPSDNIRKLPKGKEDGLGFLATRGMAQVVDETTSEPLKPEPPTPEASILPRKHRSSFTEAGPPTPRPWIPESPQPQPLTSAPTVPETSKTPSKYRSSFAGRTSSIPRLSAPQLPVQNVPISLRKYRSSFAQRHERLAQGNRLKEKESEESA